MHELVQIVLAFSLCLLILNVGLDATPGDLMSVFRSPRRLAAAFLAVNVIVPIAALILVHLAPISQVAAAGVLLMGISPVPPLAPGKVLKVGGAKAYAYGLYCAMVLVAVITVPVWVVILDRIFVAEVALPWTAVARNVALSVLIPLAVGLIVRRLAPAYAERARGPIGKVATICLLAAFVAMMGGAWRAMLALAGDGTALVMALVAVVALLAGHLLGGPTLEDRAALAVTAATRHPGIALMIASANTDDARVKAAILGFLLVGMLAAAPYQLWLKRRRAA